MFTAIGAALFFYVKCNIHYFLNLVFLMMMFSPPDGLDNFNIQEVVEISSNKKMKGKKMVEKPSKNKIKRTKVVMNKKKRTKNSYSKIFNCIVECLNMGKHRHMLEFSNAEKTQFLVTLRHKKNFKWEDDNISLLKELDSLNKNRKSSKKRYAEESRGRFRSNMLRLKKYFKLIDEKKDEKDKSILRKHYEIICPKYLACLKKNNIYSESTDKNYMNVENGYTSHIEAETNVTISVPENVKQDVNQCENAALNIHVESANNFTFLVNSYENVNYFDAVIKDNYLNNTPNTLIAKKMLNDEISAENEECTPYFTRGNECVDIRNEKEYENLKDEIGIENDELYLDGKNAYMGITNVKVYENLENLKLRDEYSKYSGESECMGITRSEDLNKKMDQFQDIDMENTFENIEEVLSVEMENTFENIDEFLNLPCGFNEDLFNIENMERIDNVSWFDGTGLN